MSNSNLVSYTRPSPNCSSRDGHKIERISIHHMAGNLSVETCGNVFANPERKASSQYGIDTIGRVGLYVDEAKRSWCTSSKYNDQRAVTIEVANSTIGGNWECSDAAINTLIMLCIDICKRNGIPKLVYTGDPNTGNLTIHSMYAATLCPGPYLKTKLEYITNAVNKALIDDVPFEPVIPDVNNDLIAVDGKWGIGTTSKAQRVFGTTVDGVISNQMSSNRKYLQNAYTGSWQFKANPKVSGSMLVKAMQATFGSSINGQFGVDDVKAMQRFLGDLTVDGYMGPNTVKAFQAWLNVQ